MRLFGLTDETQLEDLAKKLGVRVDGIYTIDEAKALLKRSGTYIILLRGDSSIGHWVAYHRGQYFDSFAEPPPQDLIRYVKKYNGTQYQAVDQAFCGQWCLFWIYSQQFNRPDLLDQMSDIQF